MKESSPDSEFIAFNVYPRVLAALLKTSIAIIYQIATAVQHSPQGPAIPLPPFQISY